MIGGVNDERRAGIDVRGCSTPKRNLLSLGVLVVAAFDSLAWKLMGKGRLELSPSNKDAQSLGINWGVGNAYEL